MKKYVILSIILLLLFFFGGTSYLYFKQEALLFKSGALTDDHVFSYKAPFKELFLETEKGARINALHFYVEQPKGVVLYFRGRGANLNKNLGRFSREFTSRGYDLFVMDYRGCGKSRGHRSEKALCHDADQCYKYLLKNHFQESQIIVYGRSLGTGIATYVASKHAPQALILEAPYVSILDLVPAEQPYLPRFLIPLLMKYHLRTDEWIVKVKSPIYIFHGTDDSIVPYHSSTRLMKLITEKQNIYFTTIENGKHNNLRYHSEYQEVMDNILK